MEKIGAVILAAGAGTRLNGGNPSEKPKVLYEIGGKPMVEYTIDILNQLGIDEKVMVVGYKEEMVKDYFKDKVLYASQPKREGTAHAAMLGAEKLSSDVKQILIIQGDDSAFYTQETLKKFISVCQNAKIGFTTVKLPNPGQYGRIIRDSAREVTAIVEKETLTEEQKMIKEVNAATYFVDRDWFDQSYPKLKPSAVGQGEIIMPDLIELAVTSGERVIGFEVPESEWIGINTPEELKRADELKRL